jgi:hypothetical protein
MYFNLVRAHKRFRGDASMIVKSQEAYDNGPKRGAEPESLPRNPQHKFKIGQPRAGVILEDLGVANIRSVSMLLCRDWSCILNISLN